MRAPNQYRLVYIRHSYEAVPDSEYSGPTQLRTHTKWLPWDGKTIRTRESQEIEFRYKGEQ